MSTFLKYIPEIAESKIALALSGGPDSMALAHALAHASKERGDMKIFAITVDHGLRQGSDQEATQVGAWIRGWPNVTHVILKWDGAPESRIMEQARKARYAMMADFCAQKQITSLYLAHHQDDQAETLLLRLAAGSGLDGLGGMRAAQAYGENLILLRPLLGAPKEELVAYCTQNGIPYVTDPSNEKTEYARPRLRAAKSVLEEEGLTSKRLSVTAARLARARSALEIMTDKAFEEYCRQDGQGIEVNWEGLKDEPEEIILRILLKSLEITGPERDYAPRMEKVEDLLVRLLRDADFNGATLGRCKFAWKQAHQALYIGSE